MTAITALALVTVLAGWLWPAAKTPMPTVTAATSIGQPPVTPRLSIVVLPFSPTCQQPRSRIFRRRHHRRPDHRFVADRGHVRHLAQHCIHLCEKPVTLGGSAVSWGSIMYWKEASSAGGIGAGHAQLIDAETALTCGQSDLNEKWATCSRCKARSRDRSRLALNLGLTSRGGGPADRQSRRA